MSRLILMVALMLGLAGLGGYALASSELGAVNPILQIASHGAELGGVGSGASFSANVAAARYITHGPYKTQQQADHVGQWEIDHMHGLGYGSSYDAKGPRGPGYYVTVAYP